MMFQLVVFYYYIEIKINFTSMELTALFYMLVSKGENIRFDGYIET